MCAGALGWSQIGKVVYGASDEKRGFRKFAPEAFHPKTEVISGVLENECSQLMKEFFLKKR
jgi:tRNA(adenine34) deaminase